MLSQLWLLLVVPGIPLSAVFLWMALFNRKRERQSRRPFHEMQRPAGYSLQKRAEALMDSIMERVMLCMITGLTAWGMHLSGKFPWWIPMPMGLIICSIAGFLAVRQVGRLSNSKLGLLGEQLVGQILDRLSSDSIHIFHDIEFNEPGCPTWNIDHVVLTPAGVFAIETKTRRKPQEAKNGHKVKFDGHQLDYPAPLKSDRQALVQAARQAEKLSEKLTAWNGEPITTIPAVVLPGWWVEGTGKGPVAAFNPKNLRTFIMNRPTIFTPARIKAIQGQLSERCRIDLSR